MEHAAIIAMMIMSFLALCAIMPTFVTQLVEYFSPVPPALAWSVQGFIVAGVNTKRYGAMYQFNVRLG